MLRHPLTKGCEFFKNKVIGVKRDNEINSFTLQIKRDKISFRYEEKMIKE